MTWVVISRPTAMVLTEPMRWSEALVAMCDLIAAGADPAYLDIIQV